MNIERAGKYNYRIDVTAGTTMHSQMVCRRRMIPALMEKATDALLESFKKDRVAVMTGIYTSDGKSGLGILYENLKSLLLSSTRRCQSFPPSQS